MPRSSQPLSVLWVLADLVLHFTGGVASSRVAVVLGAYGRGQLALKGLPLSLPFQKRMSVFLPPPAVVFTPTPQQVSRAGNNSASLETDLTVADFPWLT